jgi:hypothetical protein
LAIFEPIATLQEPTQLLDAGDLFYFPSFKDARLYAKSGTKFKLVDTSLGGLPDLIESLRTQGRPDCHEAANRLNAHRHNFEVFAEL